MSGIKSIMPVIPPASSGSFENILDEPASVFVPENSWKKKPANPESKTYKIDKALFIKSVSGEWDYTANRKQLTKACFSEDIPFIAINMLSYPGDTVMDPFSGSGTTGVVASKTGRHFIGIELSEEYLKIMKGRLQR